MRKYCIIALVLAVTLAIPVYADTETEARRSFFFSTGLHTNSLFNHNRLLLIPELWLQNYTFGKIGANISFPLRYGYATAGLETGFASGSRFGGSSGVDLIPMALTAAYYYPLIENVFSFGPRLTLGALSFRNPDWSEMVAMIGGRFDVELQFPYLPVSLYSAVGIDMFPIANQGGNFPVVEIGLRFPRTARQWPGTGLNQALTQMPSPEPGTQSQYIQNIAEIREDEPAQALALTIPTQELTEPEPETLTQHIQNIQDILEPITTQEPTEPETLSQNGIPDFRIEEPAQTLAQEHAEPEPETLNQEIQDKEHSQVLTELPVQDLSQDVLLNSIYFEPDTAVLIEAYRPALEAVGRELAADPYLRIHLRAYTAPFRTATGRLLVSEARADFSRDYLIRNFGISPDRITTELFGSERTPQHATDDWVSHRCVELITYSELAIGGQRLMDSVYFEPDTAVLIEASRINLETVGRELAANPHLRIHLRAYTAPFGAATGRLLVSQARANFSRDYLIHNFGIQADRITTEIFGSKRTPEYVNDDWASYRCVEFIIHYKRNSQVDSS